MNCVVCNRPLDIDQTVNHHISYEPETIVKVHRRCHFKIHNTNNFPELKPSKESIQKFYNGHEEIRNAKRPAISEDLVNEVRILTNNISGSFEQSLRIIIDELEELEKQKEKNVSHE